MYTFATKTGQSHAMRKSAINSNNSTNNLQLLTTNSRSKDGAFEFKIPSQVNKNNPSKSKFMMLGTSKLSTQASNACLNGKISSITKRDITKSNLIRKSNRHIKSTTKAFTPINKIPVTENSTFKKKVMKSRHKTPLNEKIKTDIVANNDNLQETSEVSVQTNEAEILNHLLIVGDLKIIAPSKFIIDKIAKLRKDKEMENISKVKRKFEAQSQKEEQHLDDLNEFLNKNFITRKIPKLKDNVEEDRKLIASMDELLQREKPKTESITDIRCRIKRKEQELLSLFDRFQRNQFLAK